MNVFSNSGVGPYTPSLVGGTLTTAKIFPSLLGPGFNNGGGNLGGGTTVPTPTTGTPAATVQIRGTGEYEQQQIDLRAGGYIFVHGTSPTVNFLFQQGSSFTSGSNTTMATLASGQSLSTGATYPWFFKATLQGDSVSGVMQIQNGVFSCNGVSGSLTLTDLTGINLTTTNYNFVIGVSFSVSDSLNKAAMSQFVLGT